MKKIKLRYGSITINDEKNVPIYESVEAWKAEGERRYGPDVLEWKVKCPMCGHVATVKDFKEAGAKGPDDAFFNCIGRYTGKGSPKEGDSSGCNWAAYGLFGIPKGGAVVMKNEDESFQIFDFADEVKEGKEE